MPSVGLDLVEIGRVQKAMKRSRFCRKILGGEEYRQLEKRGITATVRRRLGSDIDASCGQLRRKALREQAKGQR